MIRIPDYMFTRLRHIQTHFPEAVIAGGALRDLHFNKSIKDVDVFVSSLGKDSVEGLIKGLYPETEFSGPTVYQMIPESIADYTSWAERDGIRGVWQVIHDLDTPPLQIIALDRPVSMFSIAGRCDFGFCQVASDGYSIHYTDAFHFDATFNAATYTGPYADDQIMRSRRRSARLKDRYPDRQFIFPALAAEFDWGLTDNLPVTSGMQGVL